MSVRNSLMDTCSKNALDSINKIATMAKVVKTATKPAESSNNSMARSRSLRYRNALRDKPGVKSVLLKRTTLHFLLWAAAAVRAVAGPRRGELYLFRAAAVDRPVTSDE